MSSLPMLRLRLTPNAERHVRARHPWVYSDSVTDMNREGDVGELAVIYDRENKFLAIGLYDPTSPLRVRILHAGKPVKITREWWRERLASVMAIRLSNFDENTNGYRCVSGENDGFPGMVVDRYADVLVMKLYSAAWLPWLDDMLEMFVQELKPSAVVLRMSRNMQEIALKRWNVREGLVHGQCDPLVVFRENGILFEAEVMQGQKTGFYLDQRENRARVQQLAKGTDMLNVFSFSGGFSLYAARGGARSVTDLDISKHALDSARRNFALNDWAAAVPHECVQADAFDWLATGPERGFDLIVCDPPSMAKRAVDKDAALRAYHALATSCVRRLRPGGVLVAASCSAHVSEGEFHNAVQAAMHGPVEELWRSTHALDHPATFQEAHYLKCVALRLRR